MHDTVGLHVLAGPWDQPTIIRLNVKGTMQDVGAIVDGKVYFDQDRIAVVSHAKLVEALKRANQLAETFRK